MKRFLVTLSLIVTMFSINFDSKAAVITAVSNGNWNNPFTWDFGVPQCGDTVMIPSGIVVSVTVNVDLDNGDPLCPLFRMTISGDLRFSHGKKMHLATGACVGVEASGSVFASAKGGGASESIYIGPDRVWQASGGTLNGVASLGCAILLPVNLVDFSVLENNPNLTIVWEISSESNLDHYLLEFSENGQQWQFLANVEQISTNHGSSNKSYEYTTRDINSDGYFKLTAVDIDGKNTILRMISFKPSMKDENKLVMSPNPVNVNELVSISYQTIHDTETTIRIVDQRGTIIFSISKVETTNNGEVIFDTSVLKSGTYFVNLVNQNQSLKSKLAVL